MKKLSALILIAGLILVFCACNQTVPLKEFAQTNHGKVKGEYLENSGIIVFKGIPFAAPPVGDLRWKAPQPAENWEGIKECTKFSASPIQRTPEPFMMWTQEFIAPKEPLSEDCLYLNVWTKAKQAGENRPVFVYIYGGGFNSGSAAVPVYDGEAMAKKGVVFVTINYRVGSLGFLAHPGLTAESENNASGNYGLLDQIAALKWVNKNIKAFGGDPGNVTIGGQSAGAFSVNYLVASPLTKGLIHHAIAESGGAVMTSPGLARGNNLSQAEAAGEKWAESLGAFSVGELRAMPANKILAAGGPSSPIVDGYVIPEPMPDIFSKGNQNDIPLILGWNKDEGFGGPPLPAGQFKEQVKKQFGDKAGSFFELFPIATEAEAKEIQNEMSVIQTFGLQLYKWMLLQNQTGKANVYLYRFDRDVPFADGMNDHGAFHTGEVPYAYNNLKMSPRPWTDIDYELAETMSDYWVNFAVSGNPNSEDLPDWEPCTPQNLKSMVFDETAECQPIPGLKILKFLDNYYSGQN